MSQLRVQVARFRRLWLPIVAGFFLIVYISFGLVYLQQQQAQKGLKGDVASKVDVLSRPTAIGEKLQADYEEARRAIPLDPDVIGAVLRVAEESGFIVKLEGDLKPNITITQQGVARKEQVGRGEYRVLPFTVKVSKVEYDRVMSFIRGLYEEPDLATLVLESITLDGAGNEVTATIDFMVYARASTSTKGG